MDWSGHGPLLMSANGHLIPWKPKGGTRETGDLNILQIIIYLLISAVPGIGKVLVCWRSICLQLVSAVLLIYCNQLYLGRFWML